MRRAALAAALACAGPAAALELIIPVDCEVGGDCYVQSLVDRDPGPDAVDYTCGSLTYDGHKGVDIRMATLAAMRAGVDVLAAAPGVVKAVRVNEPDAGREGMREGRDCGNGVVIDHGGGWETQYCHLARRSVGVAAGDRVQAGDALGRMGLSGNTEFPHLHFSVRKDGATVDPFDARPASASCELAEEASLWSTAAETALAYAPGGVVDGGFAEGPVELDDVRAGLPTPPLGANAEALVFWSRFYGLRTGDEVRIELTGPGGEVAANEWRAERPRAEHMLFAGARPPGGGWPAGRYDGEATIIRDGAAYAARRFALEIDG
ncbi:MAG: M23 family metallopeptidase [Pseudomonadota bacterium]